MNTIPWNLIGFNLSGDLGGLTMYTDKNRRKVVFEKSPPEKPPTALQIHQRNRFRLAQQSWRALTAEQKEDLEEACRRGSLVMGGCALWISACLANRNESLQALGRQTGIALPNATFIPN